MLKLFLIQEISLQVTRFLKDKKKRKNGIHHGGKVLERWNLISELFNCSIVVGMVESTTAYKQCKNEKHFVSLRLRGRTFYEIDFNNQ